MKNKRFVVEVPTEKYTEAAELAKANGLSVNAFVRSLLIRATLMPEHFGFVPMPNGDFRDALVN